MATGQEPRGPGGVSPRLISVYDTTLRDGMQGEGMSLSADEKVRVAHALDSLGVHLIEAGFPASNPKEVALFELLAGESFETAEVVAFGMTRRRDVSAEDDPSLWLLADSFARYAPRGQTGRCIWTRSPTSIRRDLRMIATRSRSSRAKASV